MCFWLIVGAATRGRGLNNYKLDPVRSHHSCCSTTMSGGWQDLGLLPELVKATQDLGWLCVNTTS